MMTREDFSDGIASLSDALSAFGRALKQTASSVAEFTGTATRSYYDIAGQYTYPLPPTNNPTKISDLGIGQIPLIIFPILPIAALSSLTWIPLIGNSAQSIKTGFMRVISLPLLDVELNIHDDRSYLRKCYGAPGLVIGGCLGLVASAIILPARILYESLISCSEAYVMMLDLALPRGLRHIQRNLLTSDRHLGLKIGLGLPGVIVGTILGSIGLVTSFTMRHVWSAITFIAGNVARGLYKFFTECFISYTLIYTKIINLALPAAHPLDPFVFVPGPRKKLDILIGLPGFILGFVSGVINAAFIGIARSIYFTLKNNILSFIEAYVKVTNLSLAQNYQLQNDVAPRSAIVRYGVGFIGGVLGGISGALSDLIIFAVRGAHRFLTESAISFERVFITLVNKVLPEDYRAAQVYAQRNKLDIALGLPGFILGGISGLIASAIVIAARLTHFTLKNIAISFSEAYVAVTNLSLPAGYKIEGQPMPRHPLKRFGVGLLGIVLGGVCGAISSLVIFIARGTYHALSYARKGVHWFVRENVRSFLEIYSTIMRHDYHYADPLHIGRRLSSGLIGTLLGAALGSTVFIIKKLLLATFDFIKHTTLSFAVLSGSLLNGAANRVLYAGLAGDTRSKGQKAAGLLGYVMAIGITAPIAASITVTRNATIGLGVLSAFICSPIILLAKLVGLALTAPRFKPQEMSATDQQFRRLYSSLSAFGDLPTNKPIVASGTGEDSAKLFMWKSAKLNLKTSTERTLDAILAAHRNYRGNQFVNSPEYQAAVTNLKNRTTVGFFTSPATVRSSHHRIDKTAEFVADFLQGNRDTPPVIKTPRSSWFGTFYGKKPDQALQAAIHAGARRHR